MKKHNATKTIFWHSVELSLVVVLLLLLVSESLGWLSIGKNVDANGGSMDIEGQSGDFELYSIGPNAGVYADVFSNLGVDVTSGTQETIGGRSVRTTSGQEDVYWYVSSTSNMSNATPETTDSKLRPGSSGSISFGVHSNITGELNISLKLSFKGFSAEYEPVSDQISALLSGHLLFFREYDSENQQYSNFLADGEFTQVESDVTAGDYFEYTLYWIWPENMGQFLLNTDGKLSSTAKAAIITKMDEDVQDVVDHEDDETPYHSQFFYYPNSFILRSTMTESNLTAMVYSTDNNSTYNTINSFFNQGDQAIGLTADYALIRLGTVGVESSDED